MADRQDSDREVLTSLPRSRPVRRSTKRPARPAGATKPAAKKTPATAPRTGATKKTGTPTAKARAKPRATATPEPERVAPPRKVPPAGYAAPAVRGEREPGSGPAEMLSTAVQAANELTQIGLTVGRQALQSLLDRLPRP